MRFYLGCAYMRRKGVALKITENDRFSDCAWRQGEGTWRKSSDHHTIAQSTSREDCIYKCLQQGLFISSASPALLVNP